MDPANFDTTCAPCRDFFQFTNGGWDRNAVIPPQYSTYGVGREVMDRHEAKRRSRRRAAATPAKPPPRIRMRITPTPPAP